MMLSRNDIKYYSSLKKKKYREQEGKFLIEGYHLVEECVNSSYIIECVIYFQPVTPEKSDKLLVSLGTKNIPVHVVNKDAFGKLSETESSQGIAAVVHSKENPPLSEYYESDLIIALDKVTDPGNLGTIIRTSYWFGAGGVLIGKNSVDLYNDKAVRSTQGGLFHMNISHNLILPDSLYDLHTAGFEIFVMDVNSGKFLNETGFGKKSVFVFGNEAGGISEEVRNLGFSEISIKGYSDCESLNVASSCAIVMNEFRSRLKK